MVLNKKTLFWLTIGSSALVFILFLNVKYSNKLLLQTLGLILSMWGAFLLASDYSEEMFSNTGYLGSNKAIDGLLKKQYLRKNIGILLLILGFVLQGLSQFID